MNLTFKGFLHRYCRELTGQQTDNLRKLCKAVVCDQPAAAEALMVFAALQGKADYLVSFTMGTWLHPDYTRVSLSLALCGNVEAWLQSDDAPERYKKVWNAYQAKKNEPARTRRINALMRDKICETMRQKGLTTYRICKDLDLNLGNVYAYLGKGDVSKVSCDTARRIMEYSVSF